MKGKPMPTKLSVVLLSLLCGCSTTATISRINGTRLEAEIQHTDGHNLVVQTDAGHKVRIPKSEVANIDHPGNVAAFIGAALSTYGMVNIALGASTCRSVGGAFCAGVFAPAAIGVPILAWGLMTWSRSTKAVNKIMPPFPDSVPSPPPSSPFEVSSSTPGGKARAAWERAGTGVLQNIRWGMSSEQIRRLYTDVEASSPDILSTRRLLAGNPATVHFGFLDGQLTRVQAELARSQSEGGPADVFGYFKRLLGQQYGPPLAQSEGSVTWSEGGTTIQLLAAGDTGAPVKLVYERGNGVRTALEAP